MTDPIGTVPQAALVDLMQVYVDEEAGTRGICLPWQKVNKMLSNGGGLRPGKVSILAGAPGCGKSWMGLAVCDEAHRRGQDWLYLGLEEDPAYWLRCLVALRLNSWEMMSTEQAGAKARNDRLVAAIESDPQIATLQSHVCQNPRTPVKHDYGVYCPGLDYGELLDSLTRLAEGRDLICIDPLSMIDFCKPGRRSYELEGEFIQRIAGIAQFSGCHFLILHHITKDRARAGRPLCLDDVAGASGLTKHAQYVLILDAHEPRTSEIFHPIPNHSVSHKRTLLIAKGRFGAGTGLRFAYDFSQDGPAMTEHGALKPKAR